MPDSPLSFDVTFEDFKFLQGYMARRVFARDKSGHLLALLGVVVCATLLAFTIVLVSQSYRFYAFSALGLRYPASFYLLLILLLLTALFSLFPAVKMRLKTLRMQVSDKGPLLGATRLTVETDGLRLDRPSVSSKYFWTAFQGVEMVKDAIVLPVDNGIGLIVPAKAFPTPAARLEFAAAIAKHLETAKHAG